MSQLERLLDSDLDWESKDNILRAPWPARNLLLQGLSKRTVKCVLRYDEPCTFKGTLHTRNIADLRGHHLTRKHRSPNYAVRDCTLVAKEATKFLQQRRSEIKAKVLQRKRSGTTASNKTGVVPLPGCTKGKQNTVVPQLQEPTKYRVSILSPLSQEVNENVIRDVPERSVEFENIQFFYRHLSDFFENDGKMIDSELDTYINDSTDDEVESDTEVTGSSMAEPDDFDTEMAKAEEEGLLNVSSGEEQTPGLATPNPVSTEESRGQSKRKRESASSPESSTADLPGHVDRDLKRRRLEIGTNSSQDTAPELRKKTRREGQGEFIAQDLFSQSSSLAAVLQAAPRVGALEAPQSDSADGLGLDSMDLELLGEQAGSSEQQQSSVSDDSEVSPRITRFSNRCMINRSFMLANGYSIRRYDKPTKPSKEFQSFFATRRLRTNLLRQDKDSWSEEDTSFFLSGKKIAEPGARFGAEFVAKCLLDGSKSPLRKTVRDSQMTIRKRQMRDLRQPKAKSPSRKERRKLAQIQKSGLSVKMAVP